MRRFGIAVLVVSLASVVSIFGSGPISAQEEEGIPGCELYDISAVFEELGLNPDEDSYQWEGVCRPVPLDDPAPVPFGDGEILQPYLVYFSEDYAAVPDALSGEYEPEAMVVVVRAGSFALDVKQSNTSNIVVYGAGVEIPRLNDFVDSEPFYSASDDEPCPAVCPVESGDEVQLGPGDVVVAAQGGICVYCLLDTDSQSKNETGLLEVFVLRGDAEDFQTFSWIDSWDRAAEGNLPVIAQSASRSTTRGWAFFDPATRCKDG